MQYRIKDALSVLLVLIVLALVLWFILSRLMIVLFIPISLGGAVLVLLGILVGIILVLDHFLDFL